MFALSPDLQFLSPPLYDQPELSLIMVAQLTARALDLGARGAPLIAA